mmetsp:Transcript_16751/g.34530  ORF Transcript_16751/g.34530 Transcript_16751/m.34530 type:complete len:233 (-) Transcript_16751:2080-2778(-)
MCPELSNRAEARLFVALVSLLIGFVWLTVIFILRMDPLLQPLRHGSKFPEGYESPERLRQTNRWLEGIFDTVTLLAVLCFARSCRTDPGGQRDWIEERPDLFHGDLSDVDEEFEQHLEMRGNSVLEAFEHEVGMNVCKFCRMVKPERVYHCRVCGSCVLAMDHHCVFIGNCVGKRNLKFFFLFLLYTSLASFMSLILFGRCLVHFSYGNQSFRCRIFTGLEYLSNYSEPDKC